MAVSCFLILISILPSVCVSASFRPVHRQNRSKRSVVKQTYNGISWHDLAIVLSDLICFFFFFNRHCNPCGFWPAQLSLSILSREVFTEWLFQRHVKPRTWRTSDQNVPTPATRCPPRLKRSERTPAAEGGTMGAKLPRILPKVATSTSLLGSFTCRKLRHWTDGFASPQKEGALRYQRPASNIFKKLYL